MAEPAEDTDDKAAAGADTPADDANTGAAAEGADAGADDAKSDPEVERVAALMGWKKDFKGDKALGAADFLAKFSDVLRGTKKHNEQLQGKLDRIVGQVAKLDASQRTAEEKVVLQELHDAVEAGDTDAAMRVAKKLTQMDAKPETDEHPAFTAFKGRNDWFNVDDDATAYALALETRFAQAYPRDKQNNAIINDPDAHMRKVEAGVKKRFPELFGDAKPAAEQRRAPLVGAGGRTASAKAGGPLSIADLTPSQRKGAEDSGVTLQRYVEELNKWNEQQKARA